MIEHPLHYAEQLDPSICEAVYASSVRLLDEIGIVLQSEEILAEARDAGAHVDLDTYRIRLNHDLVEKALESAPGDWRVYARNPSFTVHAGTNQLLVAPGYGSSTIADIHGKKRDASYEDFVAFAKIAGKSDVIDITGGLLVEALDVPAPLRPLQNTSALIRCSEKPFFGSVAGATGARDSIEMARIVFPEIQTQPVMIGLININSPMRLDRTMAGAMTEYIDFGQPVLLTPGIMMGITAPVTAIGALIQGMAELIGVTAAIQLYKPGAPVMIGLGGFGADLRCAGPGFGRPENALATVYGAQIARRIGLPFRCSGGVTGSRLPDCRSGYERMMTANAAWSAGAHLCLQGAGTLDSIHSMSYEQFFLDLELWRYIKRLSRKTEPAAIQSSMDLLLSQPQDFLACDHTIRHMREELFEPSFVPTAPFETWVDSGSPDAAALAHDAANAMEYESGDDLDESISGEMDNLISIRRNSLQ